jgi:hypothetical protein
MGIWVGRYAIVEGEVREHGPWLVDRARTSGEDPVRLLVLAEPIDQRSTEFCEEVAGAVAELFARESLSITGGLLRAIQQAHVNLEEWNRRSLREHQIAVGITCLAIRDDEATIALAGPGVVYLSGRGGTERLTTAGEPAASPLGGSAPVEPLFRTISLQAQDVLLLSSVVEQSLDSDAISSMLAAGPERALAELFMRMRGLPDVTAVLVAEIEGAEDLSPAPAALTAPASAATPDRASDDGGNLDSGGLDGQSDRRSRSFPRLRRARVAGARAAVVPLPWRAIGIVAVALLAIALLARAVLPSLLVEDREQRFTEAVAAAELRLDVVDSAPSSEDRRAALDAALAEIVRARSIASDDVRLIALDARAQDAVALLDAVVDVEGLRTVIEFQGALTAPVQPSALIVGGGALWLVEDAGGRLFRIALSDGEQGGAALAEEIYRSGERYAGAVAQAPVGITWDAAGGRLLLLDAARTLFAFTSEGGGGAIEPEVLQLRDVAEVQSVQGIATYSGSLYLLDAEGGEVWRYLTAGAGYDSERTGLLGGITIDGAQALFVDRDLYLLDAEGALRRFRLGREQPLLLQGLDEPPRPPAGVVGDVSSGRLYVGDRGGHRIVASERGGDFVAQYRHLAFFDLRGLALSEDGAQLYVLTGDGIYAFAPLP